ncbi:aromatic-ring-hydroxylating dioxygenase subunit beta [Lelliottia nimipressuralis]|uniref:aromatic-ring-hydroxylating dioxygenase subunit beta n=1 Tax=Lelliottia nimipressuralis TaxID=69220 RepID=UPI003D27446E
MGFGTPDDSEAWERVQRGATAGDDLWIMLNRGLAGEYRTPTTALRSDVSAETGMRAAYQQWQKTDDGERTMMTPESELFAAVTLINLEGDLLDQGEFSAWLDLWQHDGLYVVPIDPNETDFKNTLNYACDDHHMREKRVHRLYSGESISTTPRARTLRTLSRFRLLESRDGLIVVRGGAVPCGNTAKVIAAITRRISPGSCSAKATACASSKRLIRLVNSDDVLHSIGYIL